MPEDNNDDQSVVDALGSGDGGGDAGIVGKMLKLLLPLGIAAVFATAGFFVSNLGGPDQAEAESVEEGDVPPKDGDAPSKSGDEPPKGKQELVYHDMEPLVVNLNEPRATRYLRAGLSIAFAGGDALEGEAELEKMSREVKNWLIQHLSNLSIEDVQGAKNINRARREIQDLLNNNLWPGKRPRIVNVSLLEWIVQ